MIKRTKGNQLTGAALKAHEKAEEKRRAARKALWGKRFKNVILFLATAFLGGVAGVVSFDHIRDLVILAGQKATWWYSPANLLPLAPDVLLVIAAFKARKVDATRMERLVAKASMWIGLGMSLAGNVTKELITPSSQYVLLSMVVAGSPVLLLWLATEMLTHTRKTPKATKPDSIMALIRQIVRQWFVNKLQNMKRRNVSRPIKATEAEVTVPAPTVAVMAEPAPAELPFPAFPQFRSLPINGHRTLINN